VFEKFTERARQVVVLAQEESRALQHDYIGTEHILLGLLREEEGLAARVLESLEITLERVRAEVVRTVGPGKEAPSGQIPFTPRAKKVLELALREALSLGHNYIGTESVLLGLVRENEGVAARILLDLDADAEKIRGEVIKMLSGPGARQGGEFTPAGGGEFAPARGRKRPQAIDPGWLDGLGAILDRLAAEIRTELRRDPDAGDLLLALACAPQTLAGQALQTVGVDVDALWGTIEHDRRRASEDEEALTRRIREVRGAKEQAIESREFEAAARLRDQERELVQQARARAAVAPEALRAIRRRLGIPVPSDIPEPPSLN
jgi:Clp amino terminal domain, pathogenicity island component/UvrB/uvrC motif